MVRDGGAGVRVGVNGEGVVRQVDISFAKALDVDGGKKVAKTIKGSYSFRQSVPDRFPVGGLPQTAVTISQISNSKRLAPFLSPEQLFFSPIGHRPISRPPAGREQLFFTRPTGNPSQRLCTRS